MNISATKNVDKTYAECAFMPYLLGFLIPFRCAFLSKKHTKINDLAEII